MTARGIHFTYARAEQYLKDSGVPETEIGIELGRLHVVYARGVQKEPVALYNAISVQGIVRKYSDKILPLTKYLSADQKWSHRNGGI